MCKNGLHDLDTVARSRSGACYPCYLAYTREWARVERTMVQAFIDEWKLQMGCAECGYDTHPAALQMDHIIQRAVTEPGAARWSGVKSMSHARRLIADPNIQVLCANCHCIKTRENGDYTSPEKKKVVAP